MIEPTTLRRTRALALGLAVLASAEASAEPLPPEACTAVEAEHAALVAAGLPELMKQGPAGATGESARQVARFIALREQLLFRCGHDKKRAAPAVADGEEATSASAAKDAPPPLPRRKPVAAVPSSASARARPVAPAKPERASKPATKAPSKPRAKVDDAYRPPPKAAVKSP